MKKNIIMSGVLTLALALFTTGCGLFESGDAPDNGPYYRPLNQDGSGNGAGGAGAGGAGGNGANAGNADLQAGNNGGLAGANQPTEYKEGSGLNNYDGFGTPIQGVTFQPVYFGFDQFAVSSSELNKINEVVNYLNANPGTGVVVEGNCDVRGTEEYNRALGERRALAAQEQLLAAGISPDRIKTISNGKSKLAAQGTDEESHRLNRRDEFIAVKLMK
ncbi:MAG: OmpA family protein [Lentisphaeria bacterium]|nr:OmpA family protein [Lentisphaeria bacterium]